MRGDCRPCDALRRHRDPNHELTGAHGDPAPPDCIHAGRSARRRGRPFQAPVIGHTGSTTAAYLGVESGGATGSKFGGRAISNDIIDLSLGAIFGNTLSYLGVKDDGKELPCLTTDNVAYGSHDTASFPYVQAPL